ncbi:hypothetical protein [Clostridium sp. HBUAS56017]|uniref:hypothetical protein n=1 Tax=Clostridium sp. HBUAS56017 TaxID=2571128 RepID=UPI001178AB53|nr:hypothetical protein [Clostridium sp. HBUAS56017]
MIIKRELKITLATFILESYYNLVCYSFVHFKKIDIIYKIILCRKDGGNEQAKKSQGTLLKLIKDLK